MLLPVLICVVPDIAQEKRMQRVAQARLTFPAGVVVWTTTAVLLNEQRPNAPIWLQGRPQSSQAAPLGSSLRQCLFDVFPGKKAGETSVVEMFSLPCRSTLTA
jgi:hypothetical protein